MGTNGKAKRAEKVARMQAEAARRERARRLAIAGVGVVVVLAIVAVLVVVKLTQSTAAAGPSTSTGADAALVRTVTTVPSSVLDTVAAGKGVASLVPLTTAPALTANGKPEVLYVGAEYCPYCAATRWGVVVALSRFGSFKNLGMTTSSHTDVYADTPTLSFHGSTFTSDTITFKPYETEDRAQKPLDTLAGTDASAFGTYDDPPYVSGQGGAIPFMDIGGKYLLTGSAYDPGILKGMTHQQIADALKDPTSNVAQAVDGEANTLTAAICATTDQKPSSVCSAAGVQAAATNLGSGG